MSSRRIVPPRPSAESTRFKAGDVSSLAFWIIFGLLLAIASIFSYRVEGSADQVFILLGLMVALCLFRIENHLEKLANKDGDQVTVTTTLPPGHSAVVANTTGERNGHEG